MTTPTDALRVEHEKLMTHIDELHTVAATVGPWSPREAQLDHVVTFLRDRLVPHMEAEEVAFYPAVEAAMHSPRAMETMVADHRYIARQIDALLPAAAALGSEPHVEQLEAVCAQLYALWAILRMHFDKEENVLIPILEHALTPEARQTLFEQMANLAHAHQRAAS